MYILYLPMNTFLLLLHPIVQTTPISGKFVTGIKPVRFLAIFAFMILQSFPRKRPARSRLSSQPPPSGV